MVARKDISSIVNHSLCNSCGACANVCHPKVISFHYDPVGHLFPQISYDRCTNCGLCYAICPSASFGETLTTELRRQEDPFHGTVLATYYGRSTDATVFAQSQSGGVATALMLHALELKLIDVALLTTTTYDNELKGVALLAYSREDVLTSQKSKYVPIALLEALQEIKEKGLRFGLVGVSCQIHGLKNLLDKQKKLRDLYQFSVGVICDRVMLNSSYEYLAHQAKVDNVSSFAFRDKLEGGYPGNVTIKNEHKKVVFVPERRKEMKELFTPARCRVCFDKMNIFADIMVGDPHAIPGSHPKEGDSLVVIRSEKGRALVASAEKALALTPCSYEQAMVGQRMNLKRRDWGTFARAWRMSSFDEPGYFKELEPWISTRLSPSKKRVLRYAWRIQKIAKKRFFFEVSLRIMAHRLVKLLKAPRKALRRSEG